MAKITFKHSSKEAEAPEGEWLYEVCDAADSGIPFSCKAGACGTCATEVLQGRENMGNQSAREVRTLTEHELDPAVYRLPCLCDVGGDIVFGRPAQAPEEAKAETAKKKQRRILQVEVESYRPLNLTVCEVRFYVGDESFQFRPGQYVIFSIPGGDKPIRRSYSISTPPSDRQHFEVCVRAVAGGRGSNHVHALRPGSVATVEGPFGKFVLDEESSSDILMIATGTGMAPIKSMLLHLLDKRSDRRVRLFFGLRHETDLFYTDLLRGLKAHYPAFEYEVILSRPSATGWAGPVGRVTDLVEQRVTEAQAANTDVYLCGSKAMTSACKELLQARGFPKSALRHENFY